MNAKELRAAAQRVVYSLRDGLIARGIKRIYTDADAASLACADYILATVRDEDDEPVTDAWISRYWNWRSDGHGYGYAAKIWEVGQSEDYGNEPAMQLLYEAESLWIEAYGTGGETLCLMEVKEFPTRGDVRNLCSALGIELKEPQQ